jgi:hypothetical protein
MEWDESVVRKLLNDYAELEESAAKVATIVWKIRFPNFSVPPLEISFDEKWVTVEYWDHGKDSFNFPLSYLWQSTVDIEDFEKEAVAELERKDREIAKQWEEKKLTNDRALYEKLKTKFEHKGEE